MPINVAMAQEEPGEERQQASTEGERASDIIVTGQIAFRNRTEDTNPVLSYDLEYFQRFEPVSVGEMLKRVPGVTFTSDVLEYDAVQFRGLPPGYTQVLINGRRAPGGEADRSFFVDRIPAELVEKIEIVRSPRADQPSEGVAGTLNIITKEAATFEGGFAKVGALINKDGTIRPSLAAAYARRARRRDHLLGRAQLSEAPQCQEEGVAPLRRFHHRPARRDQSRSSTTPSCRTIRATAATCRAAPRSGTISAARASCACRASAVDTNRDEREVSSTFEGAELDTRRRRVAA